METERRIIFVYNADGGPLAQLKDYVHKIVAPETYPCSLCNITFGNLGMRRSWRRFVRDLPYPAVFLHRDELAEFPQLREFPLPAVFLIEESANTLLVSADDLNRTPDLPALQDLVLARVTDSVRAAAAS